MRFWFPASAIVFALTCPVLSVADSVHLKIVFNGSEVGTNDYTSDQSGGFESKTVFKLGSIDLSGFLTGHLVKGKLNDYAYSGSTQLGKMSLVYKDGKLAANTPTKKVTVPFVDKSGLLFGNLHPAFCGSTLLAAESAIAARPGTVETTLRTYFLDLGAVISVKVHPLPDRKVQTSGGDRTARRFQVTIGAVEVEYALDDANHVVGMDVPAQKIRMIADGWGGLYSDPLAKYPELSQPTFKVKVETGIKTKLRDGVELVSDVIRPDDGDRHPTILVRTPYGRGGEALNGGFWAARGYCFVAQDCRGREDSGGEWDPFVHEGPDGYDTIQWIAQQPWSDGKVGMIGGSYVGYVQWAAATENPPALKCIVPQVSPPDAMHNLPYEFGTFFLYGDLWWSKIVEGKKADMSGVGSYMKNMDKFTTLPLGDVDKAVIGEHVPFFQKWLERDTLPKWKGWDFTEHMANSHVPALALSGNWDGDGIGTFLNWEAMRKLKRNDQWIVFGPWTHAFNTTHKLGGVEYGPQAILELDSVYLRWFDTWLKGKDVGLTKVPHVKLFVTGANKWIEASNWPTPSMPQKTLFLGPGSLNASPGKPGATTFTYDPAKDNVIPEVFKKSPDELSLTISQKELKDGKTHVFVGAPLHKTTAITGPFAVRLHFTSSAQNTDFFASIVDVAPDGSASVLGESGKIRASYLNGTDEIRPLQPGKEYVATLVPWQFAHEFLPGHRIGLLVTSSEFPMFARNLGTVDPIKTATRMVPQHNAILTGIGHESSVSYHLLWEK